MPHWVTLATMLPDILQTGLDVVFVGTAAGDRSAREGIYYAHPGNKFWPTLEAIGLIPVGFERARFREVPKFGIGLTDLCKTRSGMDHVLVRGDFDVAGLAARLRAIRPRVVAFTSKKGASTFLGIASAKVPLGVPLDYAPDFAPVFALPSPSGAARGHWDEGPWRALARWLKTRQGRKGL